MQPEVSENFRKRKRNASDFEVTHTASHPENQSTSTTNSCPESSLKHFETPCKRPKLVQRPLRRLPSFASVSSSTAPISDKTDKTDFCHCKFCTISIYGGEAGKRRHFTTQNHFFRVCKGIIKYTAPAIIPAAKWKFPSNLSFATVDQKTLLKFIVDQFSKIKKKIENQQNSVSVKNEPPETVDNINGEQIDVDFLTYIFVARPEKLIKHFLSSQFDVASISAILSEMTIWPIKFPLTCEFCIEETELTVLEREEQLKKFWKHLSSEQHNSNIRAFFREHHIIHPSLQMKNKPQWGPKCGKIQLNDFLNFSNQIFESDSYLLSPSQHQQKLEHWSKLTKMISNIDYEALKSPNSINFDFVENSTKSIEQQPKEDYMYPTKSLIDRILEFKPLKKNQGKEKQKERVGAVWADSLISFLKANPSLSIENIRMLARQERLMKPHGYKSNWFPSFAGVWNEGSRKDHKRSQNTNRDQYTHHI